MEVSVPRWHQVKMDLVSMASRLPYGMLHDGAYGT